MKFVKIFLTVAFFLFLTTFISSQQVSLGTFQKDQNVTLVQLCGNCTFNNITSVLDPELNTLVFNVSMNKDGTQYTYLLDGGNTSKVGQYLVNGVGDLNGVAVTWVYDFQITTTKQQLSTGESLIYILLVMGVGCIFLLSLYFSIVVPYSNETNADGAVIKVTRKKYMKIGLIILAYVSFIWVLNVLIGVSDNFVGLSMFYGFVSFLFTGLLLLSYPFGIFMFVLFFFELVRDMNIHKEIQKFGSTMR